MQVRRTQRRPPQLAETAQEKTGQSSPRHVMPGLVPDVVQAFRAPGKYYTTLAVANDEGLRQPAVDSCLFHSLFNRLEQIERKMAAREEAPYVRENLHVIRRSA